MCCIRRPAIHFLAAVFRVVPLICVLSSCSDEIQNPRRTIGWELEWTMLDVSPPGHFGTFYEDVTFADAQSGWLAGGIGSQTTGGSIVATTDGGKSWILQLENIGQIQSLCFVNRLVGWAVGLRGTVLNTTDGGVHWVEQDLETLRDFKGVQFVNERCGWVVGHNETVLHTTNAGSTWVWQREGPDFAVQGVAFLDTLRGWVVASTYLGERGLVLRTFDGGESWVQQLETPYPVRSITFGNGGLGWITGSNVLYRTENYGETWAEAEIDSLVTTVSDVSFVNGETGWAVGYFARVWETRDGGRTWYYTDSFGSGYESRIFKGIEFADPYNAWIVGSDGFVGHLRRVPLYAN